MVNFGEIINSSANWTVTVLFKPFKFKKWLILAFVAIMAGCMSNGCNLNFNNGGQQTEKGQEVRTSQPSETSEGVEESSFVSDAKPFTREDIRFIVIIIAAIVLIILALIMLITWLGSRFSFVFLEDVVNNDASITAPFKANREIGRSYFLFNLVFFGILLVLFGSIIYLGIAALIKAGAFNKDVADIKRTLGFLVIILPHLLLMAVLILASGLISLIATNFVIVVMFKDRIGILKAWPKVLALLKKNIANFIVYILIKAGFYICAGIIYLVTALICLLAVLIPAALLGVVFYLVSRYITAPYLVVYWVIIGIVSTPPALFLLYCLISLYMPFAVFFRTFGIKFLGRLDPQYDLIVS